MFYSKALDTDFVTDFVTGLVTGLVTSLVTGLVTPLNQISCQIYKIFKKLLMVCVQFQVFINLYSSRKQKYMKKFENFWKILKKKSFGFGKKNFGSDTDTDTHSFGRNSAPIPNFGRTLIVIQQIDKIADIIVK